MTIDMSNIENAMELYTEAEFNLYEIENAKNQEMAPIEEKYEMTIEEATEALNQQRINQHKAVADTVRNNPDWYTAEKLYSLVTVFDWVEGNDTFFFEENECYVTNAVAQTDLFSNELIMSDTSHYHVGFDEHAARLIVPQVRVDASTKDAELQELANLLEPYLDAMREYATDRTNYNHTTGQASIFERTLSQNGVYEIVTERKGEYHIGITRYGSYSDVTHDPMSLFEVLKIVRDKYWYSDENNIHPDDEYEW